jgi:hypothetical protein
MKILIFSFLLLFACNPKIQVKPDTKLTDSISVLNIRIVNLNDSIAKLNQRLLQGLTVDNFLKAYKYDRLYKYYQICAKNPSQWVYYKGWSIRVFNQK